MSIKGKATIKNKMKAMLLNNCYEVPKSECNESVAFPVVSVASDAIGQKTSMKLK